MEHKDPFYSEWEQRQKEMDAHFVNYAECMLKLQQQILDELKKLNRRKS